MDDSSESGSCRSSSSSENRRLQRGRTLGGVFRRLPGLLSLLRGRLQQQPGWGRRAEMAVDKFLITAAESGGFKAAILGLRANLAKEKAMADGGRQSRRRDREIPQSAGSR
jgi:hypothetical protein